MTQLNLYTSEDGDSVVKESFTTQTVGGHAATDHFRGVTKLINHGKGEESVVNQWLTTAADGNLSEIPTGSQNPKQRRPCHG